MGLPSVPCASFSFASFFDHKVDDFGLADVEAGLGLENLAHLHAVKLLVALGARAPDGGAARGIEQAELDANSIGDFAHDAAERVDFADQMALGDAADGGVAAHLRDEVEVHGDERGLQAHARGSHGGLAAGMTGAHHDHIVLFGESHPILFYGWNRIGAAGASDCLVNRRRRKRGLRGRAEQNSTGLRDWSERGREPVRRE